MGSIPTSRTFVVFFRVARSRIRCRTSHARKVGVAVVVVNAENPRGTIFALGVPKAANIPVVVEGWQGGQGGTGGGGGGL